MILLKMISYKVFGVKVETFRNVTHLLEICDHCFVVCEHGFQQSTWISIRLINLFYVTGIFL